MFSTGIRVGPVGQQHYDAVEAVAHHCHVQGRVPHGAGAVHVTAPFQQHAGHLCILGPVEGAGSITRVFAVDLAAVHADDHLRTPFLRELHGRVDGVAVGAHDVAPSIAQQQHADHLLLPQLAGQVQWGQPLVIHLVQASHCILSKEL